MKKKKSKKVTYEIWLGDHHSHFERGIAHLENGKDVELVTYYHSDSSSHDSVLIDHEDTGSARLRWFIFSDKLEFYGVDADTPIVILHNTSGREIKIIGYAILHKWENAELDLYKRHVIKWFDNVADLEKDNFLESEEEEEERLASSPKFLDKIEKLFEEAKKESTRPIQEFWKELGIDDEGDDEEKK